MLPSGASVSEGNKSAELIFQFRHGEGLSCAAFYMMFRDVACPGQPTNGHFEAPGVFQATPGYSCIIQAVLSYGPRRRLGSD